jgi:hypothetical protein
MPTTVWNADIASLDKTANGSCVERLGLRVREDPLSKYNRIYDNANRPDNHAGNFAQSYSRNLEVWCDVQRCAEWIAKQLNPNSSLNPIKSFSFFL